MIFPVVGDVWSGVDLISRQIKISQTSGGIKISSLIYKGRGGVYDIGRTVKREPAYSSRFFWEDSTKRFVITDSALSQGYVRRKLVLQVEPGRRLRAEYSRKILGAFGLKTDVIKCDFVLAEE